MACVFAFMRPAPFDSQRASCCSAQMLGHHRVRENFTPACDSRSVIIPLASGVKLPPDRHEIFRDRLGSCDFQPLSDVPETWSSSIVTPINWEGATIGARGSWHTTDRFGGNQHVWPEDSFWPGLRQLVIRQLATRRWLRIASI